jgi:tetratricopeptide (TPR) repeat protein
VQAMELFDRVLAKDPTHVEAKRFLDNSQRQLHLKIEQHFNRGLSFYANEDYDNAIREWERVLAFNPDHAQSLEYREQARQKLEALQKLMTQ